MNRPGGQIITNPITSVDLDRDIGNFFYDLKPTRDAGVGLTEQTIDYIVDVKGEPDWIREFRKNAYRVFKSKPLPTHWAGDELKEIDFDVIRYYLASGEATKRSWDDVPKEIKQTFERLGIPESERKFLAGVEAQFDSEAVYSNIKKAVSDQGVIFMGSTDALKERPDIFRKWFGKVIPTGDNKFSQPQGWYSQNLLMMGTAQETGSIPLTEYCRGFLAQRRGARRLESI
jgi:Fe-S cluster assembly protein SufB